MLSKEFASSTANSVSISVSYAWEKVDDTVVGPRNDNRWKPLRSLLVDVQKETQRRLSRFSPGVELPQRLNRLRARHGGWILESLKSRLTTTDIYIADLGNAAGDGLNYNVLLEVGMAIALGLGTKGNMFLLVPDTVASPSDLDGLLLTRYRRTDSDLSIIDLQGFRSALRASILSVAIDKGLFTPAPRLDSSSTDPDIDSESDDGT